MEKPAPDAETVRRYLLPEADVWTIFQSGLFTYVFMIMRGSSPPTDIDPPESRRNAETRRLGRPCRQSLRKQQKDSTAPPLCVPHTVPKMQLSGTKFTRQCRVICLQILPRRVGPISLSGSLAETLQSAGCHGVLPLESHSTNAETTLVRAPEPSVLPRKPGSGTAASLGQSAEFRSTAESDH